MGGGVREGGRRRRGETGDSLDRIDVPTPRAWGSVGGMWDTGTAPHLSPAPQGLPRCPHLERQLHGWFSFPRQGQVDEEYRHTESFQAQVKGCKQLKTVVE